jgi:hypothetical protein
MGRDRNNCNAVIAGEDEAAFHREHLWNDTEFALGAVTAASAFISTWLWARHYHFSHQVLVAPVTNGAQVSVDGHF